MADETTYGPAQERRTRTPIDFRSLRPNEAGRFEIGMIPHLLSQLTGHQMGDQILIDPSQTNDVGRTIQHEAIHALLMRLGRGQSQQLASSISNYNSIADMIQKSRTGNMAEEVPAYMGAYEQPTKNPFYPNMKMGETQVPQDWRDAYISELQRKLTLINPKMAKTYGLLSGQGQGQGQGVK